jgi:hypothetical protein
VLLITGSHVSALDFDLLLESLGRSQAPAADGNARGRAGRDDEQDLECGTRWLSDDDLAPAREFIHRQHRAGEPWFCYVNPRIQLARGDERRAGLAAQRTRRGRGRSARTSHKADAGR